MSPSFGMVQVAKTRVNRQRWLQDSQREVCGECGYPLDWRHPRACGQSHKVEASKAMAITLTSPAPVED